MVVGLVGSAGYWGDDGIEKRTSAAAAAGAGN